MVQIFNAARLTSRGNAVTAQPPVWGRQGKLRIGRQSPGATAVDVVEAETAQALEAEAQPELEPEIPKQEGGPDRKRQRKKRRPLSEESKRNISRGLKGVAGGAGRPKDPSHRRKIALAWRKRQAQGQSVGKTCSVCGQTGHNKRTCPQLSKQQKQQQQLDNRRYRCSICGQRGHYRTTCPHATQAEAYLPRRSSARAKARSVPAAAPIDAPPAQANLGVAEGSRPALQRRPPPAAAESPFGSGLWMEQVDDPFHLGPIPTDMIFPLPSSTDMMVKLAWIAAYRAWLDGDRLQKVTFPLPTSSSGGGPMSPNTAEQFRSIVKLSEALLTGLKGNAGLRGPLKAQLYSDEDPVGKWEGENIATVIFPTAEYLAMLRALADTGAAHRLVMCINPQWSTTGQVVSDFGLGSDRQRSEAFISAFHDVFHYRRLTVFGDAVTIMRVYPAGWQVHWTPAAGTRPVMLAVDYKAPSYQRLVELLRQQKGSMTAMSWLDRLRSGLPASWPGSPSSSASGNELPEAEEGGGGATEDGWATSSARDEGSYAWDSKEILGMGGGSAAARRRSGGMTAEQGGVERATDGDGSSPQNGARRVARVAAPGWQDGRQPVQAQHMMDAEAGSSAAGSNGSIGRGALAQGTQEGYNLRARGPSGPASAPLADDVMHENDSARAARGDERTGANDGRQREPARADAGGGANGASLRRGGGPGAAAGSAMAGGPARRSQLVAELEQVEDQMSSLELRKAKVIAELTRLQNGASDPSARPADRAAADNAVAGASKGQDRGGSAESSSDRDWSSDAEEASDLRTNMLDAFKRILFIRSVSGD